MCGSKAKCAGENKMCRGKKSFAPTPELAKIFPTNEAVNAALESLVDVARSAVTKKRHTGGAIKRSVASAR